MIKEKYARGSYECKARSGNAVRCRTGSKSLDSGFIFSTMTAILTPPLAVSAAWVCQTLLRDTQAPLLDRGGT
jgi:hypothetical protein